MSEPAARRSVTTSENGRQRGEQETEEVEPGRNDKDLVTRRGLNENGRERD